MKTETETKGFMKTRFTRAPRTRGDGGVVYYLVARTSDDRTGAVAKNIETTHSLILNSSKTPFEKNHVVLLASKF